MKDSGIEWIGEIPKGWTIKRGKFILRLLERSVKDDDGIITCFRDGEVTLRSKRREDGFTISFQENGYQGIEPGDLVVHRMDGFAGAIGVSDSRGKATPVLNVMDSDECKRYLMYHLRSMAFTGVFLSLSTGIRVRSCDTNWNKIKNLLYLLPCKEEQEKIVRYIDEKCLQIDNAIYKTTASIEEYKKLKQAIITKAVTKGIRGNRPMKDSGIEWIGEIPSDWKIEKIKYVALFSPPCDKTGILVDTVVTYLPMECVKNGKYIPNTKEFGKLSTSLNEFQDGDIIMAKVTPCFENGNIAILEGIESGYGVGSSELFVYRPTRIVGKFLFYWLRNSFFMDMGCATMTGTGGLKRVNPYYVRNCEIHYPPEKEQEEIVAYLDEKCNEIDNIISRKQQLITELEAYKKSLIYEYVTGKKEVV
ncbi:restriction endonuclease subunit S [Anaerovibrio slackiae]|uniref:restriction endonuclease subunit S n=1 Tax=Anaerovibrio slackiae TaxID=2652309 RepID=UPI00386C5814